MSVLLAPEGINVGPENEGRLPILTADVQFPTVTVGVMAAGEAKTIVITDVPNLQFGACILACSPLDPPYFLTLEIRHVWASNTNELSIYVKNDSDVEVNYDTVEQWQVAFIQV